MILPPLISVLFLSVFDAIIKHYRVAQIWPHRIERIFCELYSTLPCLFCYISPASVFLLQDTTCHTVEGRFAGDDSLWHKEIGHTRHADIPHKLIR